MLPGSRTSDSSRSSTAARIGRHRGQRRHQHPRLQGPRAGQPGLQRSHADHAPRRPRDRPHALLHHRVQHVGQRATRLQDRRCAFDRARTYNGTWSTPTSWRSSPGAGHGHHGHRRGHGHAGRADGHERPRGRRAPASCRRWTGRSASCSWTSGASTRLATRSASGRCRSDACPTGSASPGDVRARHRGRDAGTRRGAGRAGADRRPGLHSARFAEHLGPRSASSSSSTWRGPTRACWEVRARGAPRDGTPAGRGGAGRGGHGHRRAADRARRRARLCGVLGVPYGDG